ncbi:MAG: hypothetical protein HYR84_08005 [Planctomycetes bacterium]|nr:hypothetical protein [Planctomycetota bacterium]
MRHWLTRLPIASCVVVLVLGSGLAGCKREAPTPDPEVQPAAPHAKVDTKPKADKIVPANKKPKTEEKPKAGDAAGDEPEVAPAVPEPGDLAKELAAREFLEKAKAAEERPVPDPVGPETTAKDPQPTPVFDVKKKDKGKDPAKDPMKEPAKDPKMAPPEFKEPTEVGGKSFKDWLKDLKLPDPGKREAAAKAILNFGPKKAYEAVPDLLIELNKHTVKKPSDLSFRVNGVMALSTIFKYAEKPDPKHLESAFAIYKRFLSDGQVIMKIRTVQGLPTLGSIARGAIPDVIIMTRDPITWEVRKEAMLTLAILATPDGKGAGPNPDAMKAFKLALDRSTDGELKENSHYVRETAVQALVMLSQGTGVVPVELRSKALGDPSLPVRLLALQGIAQLKDEMNKETLPVWVKSLNNYINNLEKDPILLMWAHAAVMTITGNISDVHMGPIVKYLNHKDPPIRIQALTVIAAGGEKSKKLAKAPVLKLLDTEKEPAVISTIYITLARMHEWEPILAKLKDANSAIRIQALELIASGGPPAKAFVLKPVVDVLTDKDIEVVDAAIGALETLQAFETISILEGMAGNKMLNATIRDAAEEAVRNLRRMQKDLNEKKK